MTTSSRSSVLAVLFLALCLPYADAQKGGSGGGSNKGTGNPSTNNSSMGFPTSPTTPTFSQPLYIWGKVVFENGGPPPEPVAVERVCNGTTRKEGYTDLKGEFSFQLGQNFTIQDATESDSDGMRAGRTNMATTGMGQDFRQFQLMGCELRASLPGFQSSTVLLRPEGNSGQLQVGTIFLRRLGNVQGTTISLTTLMAPKNARNDFDKAQKHLKQKKLEEAERDLNKAVEVYPRFAAAWSLLGEIHEQQNQAEEARNAYSRSIDADPQFVKPYFGLTLLAVKEKRWQEVVQLTGQIDKLNPFAYPLAYLYNAAANYYLGNLDAAEKSARKFASLDSSHVRPDVALLLGDILEGKHDYAGAAQQLREYLANAPNSPNADRIRAQAQRLEDMKASPAGQQSTPQ